MFRTTSASLLFFVAIASAQSAAPTITSITSTNDAGSYILGAEINITLNFSELVTLTDAQLEIILATGETDRSIYVGAFTTAALSASATYTVRRGDTLSGIAIRYRTSVRKIKKWNGLRNDRIYIGQKLQIWTRA